MPSDESEVLAANQAFYDAFVQRDLEALDALWAEHVPVACIHPGWDALHGREEVMASWRAILGNEASPQVQCFRPEATVIGDTALVVCGESIEASHLVATNVFVREAGRWKLVLHQAGPVGARRPETRPRGAPKKGLLN